MFFLNVVPTPPPPGDENIHGVEEKFFHALAILGEQFLNSAIVGGIAGLASLSGGNWSQTWRTALLAFGMTFLVELRKYRKLA